MKTVNISFLKNNLSAILASLKRRGPITVVDRDTPVAVLYPLQLSPKSTADEQRLADLHKRGIIYQQHSERDMKLLLQPPPTLERDLDLVALLIEDRQAGL